MLIQLSIRDIVLIERLDLSFEKGLSVLTGETGAGKSILLDSLSLALGGRGDGGLVRHGEDKGQVTAVFDVPGNHRARKLLRENSIDDDGDLIFRRIQSADGRTRASINDQPVSVQMMRQVGQMLVEIHGQHDDRALIDTDATGRCSMPLPGSPTRLPMSRASIAVFAMPSAPSRRTRQGGGCRPRGRLYPRLGRRA